MTDSKSAAKIAYIYNKLTPRIELLYELRAFMYEAHIEQVRFPKTISETR